MRFLILLLEAGKTSFLTFDGCIIYSGLEFMFAYSRIANFNLPGEISATSILLPVKLLDRNTTHF